MSEPVSDEVFLDWLHRAVEMSKREGTGVSPLDHLREADHQLDALVSFPIGSKERDTGYMLVLRDIILATIELAEQIARLSAQVETVEPTLAMGPSSEPTSTDTGDLAEASVHEID